MDSMKLILWTFITIAIICHARATELVDGGAVMSEYRIIEAMLASESYDSKIHPGAETGETTVVDLNMFINDVSEVSEVNMEYTIIVYFRQEWYDKRLISPSLKKPVTLSYKHLSSLWVPDVFMPNEKAAKFHDITVPNVLLRLNPDGKLLYSRRLSLKLICILHLAMYPFDNQRCESKFESYGYTMDEVELRWRSQDPIQNNTGIRLPEFQVTGIEQENCTVSYITGTFSCMSAVLLLQRQQEYFIIQTFIPSILIVVLSWVSFWIDYRSVPARISLGLLTVLTVTTQASGISQRLPRVSYTKAIDVWMSACLVFVFMALVEYSIVNVLAREDPKPSKPKEKIHKIKKVMPMNGNPEIAFNDVSISPDVTAEEKPMKRARCECGVDGIFRCFRIPERYINCKALFLDVVSRVFFPAAFLVFNMVFWITYQA